MGGFDPTKYGAIPVQQEPTAEFDPTKYGAIPVKPAARTPQPAKAAGPLAPMIPTAQQAYSQGVQSASQQGTLGRGFAAVAGQIPPAIEAAKLGSLGGASTFSEALGNIPKGVSYEFEHPLDAATLVLGNYASSIAGPIYQGLLDKNAPASERASKVAEGLMNTVGVGTPIAQSAQAAGRGEYGKAVGTLIPAIAQAALGMKLPGDIQEGYVGAIHPETSEMLSGLKTAAGDTITPSMGTVVSHGGVPSFQRVVAGIPGGQALRDVGQAGITDAAQAYTRALERVYGKATTPLDIKPSGEAVWYHGTKAPVENVGELRGWGEPALAGPGLYMTSSKDVAEGYARTRGAGPTGKVLEGTIPSSAKFYDLDRPIEPDLSAALSAGTDYQGEHFTPDRSKSGLQNIQDYKSWLHEGGEDSFEAMQNVSIEMQQKGYDGFSYKGGQIVGKKYGPHDVRVIWPDYSTGAATRVAVKPTVSSIYTKAIMRTSEEAGAKELDAALARYPVRDIGMRTQVVGDAIKKHAGTLYDSLDQAYTMNPKVFQPVAGSLSKWAGGVLKQSEFDRLMSASPEFSSGLRKSLQDLTTAEHLQPGATIQGQEVNLMANYRNARSDLKAIQMGAKSARDRMIAGQAVDQLDKAISDGFSKTGNPALNDLYQEANQKWRQGQALMELGQAIEPAYRNIEPEMQIGTQKRPTDLNVSRIVDALTELSKVPIRAKESRFAEAVPSAVDQQTIHQIANYLAKNEAAGGRTIAGQFGNLDVARAPGEAVTNPTKAAGAIGYVLRLPASGRILAFAMTNKAAAAATLEFLKAAPGTAHAAAAAARLGASMSQWENQ